MLDIWTAATLQSYINTQHIAAEIIFSEEETLSTAAAAQALNIVVEQVAKTVLFMIEGRPYAVIANGTRRVDPRKLGKRFNVNRKEVKLADADAVIRWTGYAVGTVPPIGHREPIPVILAPEVQAFPIIYAGGGAKNATLKMATADLLAVTQAEVLDVLTDPDITNGG